MPSTTISTRSTPPSAAPGTTPAADPTPRHLGQDSTACFHCGAPCPEPAPTKAGKRFCCHGCLTVFEILTENGLGHFYDLGQQAGIRMTRPTPGERFRYLDDPAIRDHLLDFADDTTHKVTFQLPAIHCIACVWLLENLFQLRPGIGRSTVNFPRRECAITYDPRRVQLSDVAALLASLGYEPVLNLGTPEAPPADRLSRRLWLRTGLAGFAFGNTMLISTAGYLGLNTADDPELKSLFGYLSLLLALPVLLYSANEYWRAAWLTLRQRVVTVDLPIAAGLVALFAQSTYEVLSATGEGYFDSLTGLVFFLLCGKLFQHKTYDRLTFDRDYRSFFPLSVLRRTSQGEETVPLSRVAVGDHLLLRHGELVPTDARLTSGAGLIDYSFVTGEATPVPKQPGDALYAGGRQRGGAIAIETVKPVSQSYLTTLWNSAAFRKAPRDSLDTLTNRFSRHFILAVIGVALAAAAFWIRADQPHRALQAFIAVLIVACPCALALAAPFALGTAQRLLARRGLFLKSPQVLESLARVRSVVFDKTGTLTTPTTCTARFHGPPLTHPEQQAVLALARHSTHPYAVGVAAVLTETWASSPANTATADPTPPSTPEVTDFHETPGGGVTGCVGPRSFAIGSPAWLAARGVSLPPDAPPSGATHLAIDGTYRGHFLLDSSVRPDVDRMLHELRRHHEVTLLSGDGERDRERFLAWFKSDAHLHFRQTPGNKLEFIRQLRQPGHTVMMVGDGLNDAGALQESDVGVAVVEHLGAFSPASDVILDASLVSQVPLLLRFARAAVKVVIASIILSSLYNVVGLSIAASGRLSPLICAVLMPISSVTVVLFACGATRWLARRLGVDHLPTPDHRP
jgi:Cu+-exporting ATPase